MIFSNYSLFVNILNADEVIAIISLKHFKPKT